MRTGQRPTTLSLAEALEISERTVRSDLVDHLRRLKPAPLDTNRPGHPTCFVKHLLPTSNSPLIADSLHEFIHSIVLVRMSDITQQQSLV